MTTTPTTGAMATSSANFEKLKTKLRELFELDKADLDFGIYRVLRARHRHGERFAQAIGRAGIPYDLLGPTQSSRFLPASDSIKILSMHSSKGLEFPVVFLPCLDSMPAPSQEVAAEAKLLYVAMTRAMEWLHMTHHASSVFVDRLRAALGAGTAAPSGSAPA